jgi:hypothetical protein
MKRYKRKFEEYTKYIDFSKPNDFIELIGNMKDKNYRITIQWSGPKYGLNVEASIIHNESNEFILEYCNKNDIDTKVFYS